MGSYDDGSNVLVRFNHAKYESDKAHWLALSIEDEEGVWLPKSQIAHIDFNTSEVWIPLWLAEKKGLEYD
jgi:hypothetical protein